MTTLNVTQAAALLCAKPSTVREMARTGDIPAAKFGRGWVFVEEDLIDCIRSRYNNPARATATQPERKRSCCTVVQIPSSGGSASKALTEKKYASLLAPRTEKTPKSSKPS
ncbi:Helix-turn-helix domain-containing protein [Gammaproteobacteria bacterium]